jgi:Na+-driven multidrug efflux pump
LNLGAGHVERAKSAGYYAAFFNAAMMGALALLYLAFGREIVSFFDSAPAVVDTALTYLRRVGVSYIGLGVGIVLGAAMQGAGATRRVLLLDASVVLLFQLPASVLVALSSNARFEHLCTVIAVTYVAFALVHAFSYRRGRFLKAAAA